VIRRLPIMEHDDRRFVPLDELPPWRWQVESDKAWMVSWCHRKLDELDRPIEQRPKMTDEQLREHFERLSNLGPEIELAEGGNVEPLRDKILAMADLPPEVAARVVKFFCPPKPGKRRHVKFNNFLVVDAAARDVDRIKAIWRHYYPDNKHRRDDDGPSAFQIAALRWWPGDEGRADATVDTVRRRWREIHKRSSSQG
jgi:hypothetical protein